MKQLWSKLQPDGDNPLFSESLNDSKEDTQGWEPCQTRASIWKTSKDILTGLQTCIISNHSHSSISDAELIWSNSIIKVKHWTHHQSIQREEQNKNNINNSISKALHQLKPLMTLFWLHWFLCIGFPIMHCDSWQRGVSTVSQRSSERITSGFTQVLRTRQHFPTQKTM